jgi:predicted metal-dependent phosphoesterase TrpH
MDTMRKIDLHMHSTVSDGTDTPVELLKRVRQAGLELFALTDHDAIKGCDVIQRLRKPEDPRFLTGVEFSCRDEEGQYHILGYRYDPAAESIQELVRKGHRIRMEKIRTRLDFLEQTFGITFPPEEIEQLLRLDNPGKPHLANLLVKDGYAESKEAAMRDYLNKLRVRLEFLEPEEAIAGILAGGGIPVLAHPTFGNGDQLIQGEDMNRRLQRLTAYGLQGVEAFYSGFSRQNREEILGFAEQYHLYVTVGSDYHGKNKRVQLGDTGFTAETVCPEGMCRFLEAVEA